MIKINLSELLKVRQMSSKELTQIIDITEANLSILRSGKAKAIRFSTLDSICKALHCQPGDILEYIEEELEEGDLND
jgi:putative transcriptional regulator